MVYDIIIGIGIGMYELVYDIITDIGIGRYEFICMCPWNGFKRHVRPEPTGM